MREKDLAPIATGLVVQDPVETEISTSYIEYAMSVIVSRALPDKRWI